MLQVKKRFSTLNDGILFVCKENIPDTDFSAAQNPTTREHLNIIEKLCYEEMSKRDEDLSFAESIGRNLTVKVKTKLRETVSTSLLVLIGNTLYSIIKLDYSRKKDEMYFYLEEEREI